MDSQRFYFLERRPKGVSKKSYQLSLGDNMMNIPGLLFLKRKGAVDDRGILSLPRKPYWSSMIELLYLSIWFTETVMWRNEVVSECSVMV